MSKSDKKLLCWLVGTLFVLILLGVIFGVSSVRESFSSAAAEDEDYYFEEEDYDERMQRRSRDEREEEDNDVKRAFGGAKKAIKKSAKKAVSAARLKRADADRRLAEAQRAVEAAAAVARAAAEEEEEEEEDDDAPPQAETTRIVAKAAKAANISGGIPASVDPEKGYHESVGEFLNRCKDHDNLRCHNEISDTQGYIEKKYTRLSHEQMVTEMMTYAKDNKLHLLEPDARNILENNGYNMQDAMTDWIELLAEQQDNLASIA
jgi:hypothetical protein